MAFFQALRRARLMRVQQLATSPRLLQRYQQTLRRRDQRRDVHTFKTASLALNSKTCIITGSGGGLGKTLASAFLDSGANVVICDVNETRLEQTAAELSGQGPLYAMNLDVTDAEAQENLIAEAYDRFGGLDVLVNNAGIMDLFDPVGDLPKELWDRIIAVNVTAPYMLSRLAVNRMLKQTPTTGTILNVGSTSSFRGAAAGAAYTASKHALLGLTRHTAAFYRSKGIRCNIILPGIMNTDVLPDLKGVNVLDALSNPDSSAFDRFHKEGFEMFTSILGPGPGIVDIGDLAKLCVFLCSDAASGVNGASLVVDNAWSCF